MPLRSTCPVKSTCPTYSRPDISVCIYPYFLSTLSVFIHIYYEFCEKKTKLKLVYFCIYLTNKYAVTLECLPGFSDMNTCRRYMNALMWKYAHFSISLVHIYCCLSLFTKIPFFNPLTYQSTRLLAWQSWQSVFRITQKAPNFHFYPHLKINTDKMFSVCIYLKISKNVKQRALIMKEKFVLVK